MYALDVIVIMFLTNTYKEPTDEALFITDRCINKSLYLRDTLLKFWVLPEDYNDATYLKDGILTKVVSGGNVVFPPKNVCVP